MRKLILFLLFVFTSCNKTDQSHFITCKKAVPAQTVYKSYSDHDILTLRGDKEEYYTYASSELVYKDSFPSWIDDRHAPDFSSKEYKFEPILSDIFVPYVLFKKENDCHFYVVKYGDTLKFKVIKPSE